MATILRFGLDSNADLLARLQFITDHTAAWTAAWLTWMLAALSILFFFASFASAHACSRGTALGTAVLIGVVAVAIDLSAETIELGILPELARRALLESPSNPANAPSG